MKNCSLGQHDMAISEARWHQNLLAAAIGQRERSPLPILRRPPKIVDDYQVECAVQARDQQGGRLVAVNSSEHMLSRNRDIILDEIIVDPRRPIHRRVIELDVMAAKILKDRRRLDDKHAIEWALLDIEGDVR